MNMFNTEQDRLINKVRIYQEEVAERELQGRPCNLLIFQLDELLVLVNRLRANAQKLRDTLKED